MCVTRETIYCAVFNVCSHLKKQTFILLLYISKDMMFYFHSLCNNLVSVFFIYFCFLTSYTDLS
jgi:hypothetical protein